MLESLHIRNLALVSTLDLEFTAGLNVITGETGAGKSLIIGAIQLLAGGRSTPSMIRKGEKSCEAAAVVNLSKAFPELREAIESKLEAAGLPPNEENRLLLRRVVTESGSRAYVNATPVTIGFLREIGALLIDIHGPHDNQSLLLSSHQLALLDTFAGNQPLLQECRGLYLKSTDIRRQLDELANEGLNPEEAELLRHQLKEIKEANLQSGEDVELLKKYKLGENSKRLSELTGGASLALASGDNSILDQFTDIIRALREVESLDPDNGPQFPEQLVSIYDQVQTLAEQLDDYAHDLTLDTEEFQQIEERLELVQKLKRKYGPSLEDVLETQKRIKERLNKILGRGELIETLRKQLEESNDALDAVCKRLTDSREKAAMPLAEAITGKLRHLGFNKAAFQILLTPSASGPTGANSVEFMFAPNVGEDLQSLRNTASSGETARVMLAVKTVLSEADAVPILVFDEIDANVGGRVAGTVADELRAVARHHQVFSITHLPQIAAAADNHYLVEKHVENDRTVTDMQSLDMKARTSELIRMLGADVDSYAAEQHAKELLNNALRRNSERNPKT
ncbi:MAG: DNA repair protein RecN [Victivallales bacterium]|nr:DNA repair protein RecN [Victivallales bacterium]